MSYIIVSFVTLILHLPIYNIFKKMYNRLLKIIKIRIKVILNVLS